MPNVFIPQYNNGPIDDYKTLEIEYEKSMDLLYFGEKVIKGEHIGTKKRYYGIVSGSGEKYIRGMNIIRKDAPTFLKSKLNLMSEFAVRGQLRVEHLNTLRKLIELQPLKSIGVTKKFSRPFHKYEKTKPQHLRAALWANEKLGTEISYKDNPFLFYIVSHCEDEMKPRERRNAICLLESDLDLATTNPEIFSIDYEEYFKKQVLVPLQEFDLIPTVKEAIKQYKETLK